MLILGFVSDTSREAQFLPVKFSSLNFISPAFISGTALHNVLNKAKL